ncbi:hypothetical protein C1A50_1169 [Paenibacillus polymyxa]|nr:hypothetical protein C1A50_1169 [Paenibacillus polymyxa]
MKYYPVPILKVHFLFQYKAYFSELFIAKGIKRSKFDLNVVK